MLRELEENRDQSINHYSECWDAEAENRSQRAANNDERFAWVVAKAGSHIDLRIGMVDGVKTPEQMNAVRQPV